MPPASEWLFELFRLDPANACLWRGDHESEPPQVSHVLGDPQVSCLIYAARALWCLGYPDQSRLRMHQADSLVQRLSHPYSWCGVTPSLPTSISCAAKMIRH
jgi:hypothetical protein